MKLKHILLLGAVILFCIFGLIMIHMIFFGTIDSVKPLAGGYYGNYTINCNINFLQPPTNCMIKDEFGVPVTEDFIHENSEYCWAYPRDGNGVLPCTLGN